MSAPVTDAQRFSRQSDRLCPVCGGGSDDPQGESIRCFGFMTGGIARCTRENFAKGIPVNTDNTATYTHLLNRDCRCGTRHSAPRWWQPVFTPFEYKDNGLVVGTHLRWDWPDGKQTMGWTGLQRDPKSLPLYGSNRLDGLPPGSTVIVVEGEKKVEMLLALDIAAVGTATGAPTTHEADAFKVLLDFKVICWGDIKDKGPLQQQANVARLQEIGHPNTRVVPAGTPAPDDFIDAGNGTAQIEMVLSRAALVTTPTATPRGTAIPLAVIWGKDVQMENVDWVWDGRIPRGSMTLIVGDPEDGKTTYCIGDYAARVSRGARWPDGKPGSGVGEKLMYLSSEDSNSTTLMPRFTAGGGDPTMICFETLTEGIAPLNSLDTDIARLEATVVATGVKHLLFDPLNAYLPKVNTWKDSDIRSALRPLVSLAEKYGLTILVIIHLNKKSDGPAIGRVMGSMGNVALARASFLIGKDPENPSRRFFVKHKFNLGPPPAPLAFSVEQVTLDGVKDSKGQPVVASQIVAWETTSAVDMTAERLLKPPKPEKESKQDRAVALIRSMVKDGPRLADEIESAVRDMGIGERTLKGAMSESGAQAIKGRWKNAPWYRTPPSWTLEQRENWVKRQKKGG